MNNPTTLSESAIIFCRRLALIVITGCAFSIGFVALVDPYNLYDLIHINGVNAKKPDPSRYLEQIKLTQAKRLKPNFLILGNSRAEIGFNPENGNVLSKGYSTFNLGVRGTSIATSHRQLRYLIKENIIPNRILVCLDFIDFLDLNTNTNNSTAPILPTSFPVEQWFWQFDSLFSMTSIKDSISTILIQDNAEAPSLTSRGFNPLKEYEALARTEGYNALFRQRAEENIKTYLKKSSGDLNYQDLLYLREILNEAIKHNIEVTLLIYPYHAQIMSFFDRLDLMPKFAQWKSRIVDEIEKIAPSPPSNIQLIDFSGFGYYQCEEIPAKDDLISKTQWYWEAGHFKSALGDKMLEKVLSLRKAEPQTNTPYSEFGLLLVKENLELNIRRINRERDYCVNRYAALFSNTDALLNTLRNRKTINTSTAGLMTNNPVF